MEIGPEPPLNLPLSLGHRHGRSELVHPPLWTNLRSLRCLPKEEDGRPFGERVKPEESLEPPTIPVHRLSSGGRGHMEQSDFNEYQEILQTLRQGLEQQLRKREEIAVENNPDTLDQVQHAADRELAISRLELDSSRLKSVREAIQRIEDGTYGTCLRCDAEISPKRLRAVPWTEYCLKCQDTAESDRTQTRNEIVPKVAPVEEPELV